MANRVVSVDETFTLPAPVRTKLQSDLGATAPADVLGMTVANPTAQQRVSHANGSTLTAVEPAVLTVTFTAPLSGRVTIDLETEISTSGGPGFWGLISGGSPIPEATTRVCSEITSADSARYRATLVVGDLTPGVSYTYQWGTATMTGSMNLSFGGAGSVAHGNSGPAVMIVRDAPF